jgi:hypothetical protein
MTSSLSLSENWSRSSSWPVTRCLPCSCGFNCPCRRAVWIARELCRGLFPQGYHRLGSKCVPQQVTYHFSINNFGKYYYFYS